MLTPLNREQLNSLIPPIPTSDQYNYFWGTGQDLFKRILISAAAAITSWILFPRFANTNWELVVFILGGLGALYWLLGPVPQAAWKNNQLRKYPHAALWCAFIDDCYLSEETSSRQENVDDRGRLEVSYATESFINLVLGDEEGIEMTLRAPMQRSFKRIEPDQRICLVVFAADERFQRISRHTTDAYIPQIKLWVSNYPYLRRDTFAGISKQALRWEAKLKRS